MKKVLPGLLDRQRFLKREVVSLVGAVSRFFISAIFSVLLFGLWVNAGSAFAFAEQVELKESNIKESYDLIVVGSDPEGVAAALSGARNGLSTLLVDTRPVLGGLMTVGWLNTIDMSYGPQCEILNGGIFSEFFSQLEGDSFDVQTATNVFHQMVNEEENLDVLMQMEKVEPVLEKGRRLDQVKGVNITVNGDVQEISAFAVIDATQDADLAALAGVPYTYGQADFGRPERNMAVTLVFRLEGITSQDWSNIMYYLNYKDRDRNSGANYRSAWGFGNEAESYNPMSERVSLRGLNVGLQNDGSVLINALHIFDVYPLRAESKEQARTRAIMELPRVIEFINREIPGFANARLAGVATELYVRESRHILGEYRLTIEDVLENRDFYDRVAFGSYPVDVQSTSVRDRGYVVGNPVKYAVPFRCLIPQGVENLLVVGRSASFDSLAAGSARTIPVGMAAGQSAGAAVALSMEEKKSFRELAQSTHHMEKLQQRLNEQGMALEPFEIPPHEVIGHWAYSGLKFMRGLGIARGGYNNDYGMDLIMDTGEFLNVLLEAAMQTEAKIQFVRPQLPGGELNIYQVARVFCRNMGQILDGEEAFDYLKQKGFWDEQVLEKINENDQLVTRGAAYMLVQDYLDLVGYEDPSLKYIRTEGK